MSISRPVFWTRLRVSADMVRFQSSAIVLAARQTGNADTTTMISGISAHVSPLPIIRASAQDSYTAFLETERAPFEQGLLFFMTVLAAAQVLASTKILISLIPVRITLSASKAIQLVHCSWIHDSKGSIRFRHLASSRRLQT